MAFDFDTVIDRRGSDSMKWARYAGRDVLPMWVADMDFAAPPAVQLALQERIAHGVFGYSTESASLAQAAVDYLVRHYDWQIDPEWLVWLPGLVSGLNITCKAVPGGVFTATPIYPPFMTAPAHNHHALNTHALVDSTTGYGWDFEAVAKQLASTQNKLWLLCHPHNPVGRVWRDDELREIARLAREHDLVVCSDEIHCDLILDPAQRHRPFATLDADAQARSITLMAPSKTYNIPGLGTAFAVIPDPQLRANFKQAMVGIVPHLNVLGLVALEASLRDCDDWRLALLEYLRGNAELVTTTVNALPGLRMHAVEATYLAWIDMREFCRERNISDPKVFLEQAGIGISPGHDFSLPGNDSLHVRLNFGCPRATLTQALHRLKQAMV
ncbi:MAG TPA: PatB family C-S lyase [Rhodocyclaceae bacterium]|nr:PatB family C-S lyase [Rhodocyclaceae bacterium]